MTRQQSRVRSIRLPLGLSAGLAAAVAVSVIAGCGASVYEQRLAETGKYFDYLDKVERHLAPKPWSSSGIKLRVPLQFERVTAPAGEDPGPDLRQPNYLKVVLPGLEGTWKGMVNVGERAEKVPCYLYVMSNHYLFRQGRGKEAQDFRHNVMTRLAEALDMDVPGPERWSQETHPDGRKVYVDRKEYFSIKLTPEKKLPLIHGRPGDDEIVIEDEERERDLIAVDFSLYEIEAGDIQVSLLFVIPQAIDPVENMHDSIPYCLETVEVSKRAPGPGGGGAPKKRGRGSGF